MTNGQLYREAIDAIWNRGELDRIAEFFVPEYVGHQSMYSRAGHEGMRHVIADVRSSLAPFRYEVEEVIERDDMLAARWTVSGIHSGPYRGVPPTRRMVSVKGLSINRYRDGKIVEGWISWDLMSMMKQIAGEANGLMARAYVATPPAPILVDNSLRNERIYREIVSVLWEQGDLSLLDRYVSDRYVGHDSFFPRPGKDAIWRMITSVRESFSNLHYRVDQIVASGDTMVTRWTILCRHTAPFHGIAPSGRNVEATGMSWNRFYNGQLVEGWVIADMYEFLDILRAAHVTPA